MGFCVFNNVVIGALRALAVHGAKRAAVVDFDVHHGNGSQTAAEHNPNLFYASTHQWPLYPGTGPRVGHGSGQRRQRAAHAGNLARARMLARL